MHEAEGPGAPLGLRLILVEDNEADADLALLALARSGTRVTRSTRVDTAEALVAALADGDWDLVLCDYNLPRFGPAAALRTIASAELDIPLIVLSGTIGEEATVSAMKAGAADVVLKANLGRLPSVIERELLAAQVRRAGQLAEQALQHSQLELEQTRRLDSLGLLAGGVAHDFNNLLGVILNYAEFLRKPLAGDHQATADLDAIVDSARRAADMTRQLLAFGRREVVRPRVVDLAQVVGDLEGLLGGAVGNRVRLDMVMQPDLWPVTIDPGQFEQVVLNLAVNGRDAMPDGGDLSILGRNVDLDAEAAAERGLQPGRHVCLSVRDTGSGIDEAVRAQVFEPFFTTKPKGEGTGLGLASAYGIVRQAGGDIQLDSTPGQGTTFTVYLPASGQPAELAGHTETASANAGAGDATATSGHETILVVDDEDAFREMTSRILAERGYATVTATGAEQAETLFNSDPAAIHLVLTDVAMPGRSGVELADALRRADPAVRVLFMSAHPGLDPGAAGTVDAERMLAKPFSQEQLLQRVRSALDA